MVQAPSSLLAGRGSAGLFVLLLAAAVTAAAQVATWGAGAQLGVQHPPRAVSALCQTGSRGLQVSSILRSQDFYFLFFLPNH